MSIRQRFNKIFGLEDDVEEEKKRFVDRVNQSIFHQLDTVQGDRFNYRVLFDLVCFELGVNAQDFRDRILGSGMYERHVPASLRTLTQSNFKKTLLVLCILYAWLEITSDTEKNREWLSGWIKNVLDRCSCDIGIRWKDGFFYPSGAEELDKFLIEETLTWLNDYPDERKDYQRALECYQASESLTDVIKNCYSAVEGVTRKVLGNQKNLDNNKDALLEKMDLSDGWKKILANYITYAHDYRHASEQRHEIKEQEAEAYLYMTGLIIRLIIESK
jgi:hypothetical protein